MMERQNCVGIEMPTDELANRIQRFRAEMEHLNIDMLIITGAATFEYVTGRVPFNWDLHARPCFAVLGQSEFVVVGNAFTERGFSEKPRAFQTAYYNGFQADAIKVLLNQVANMAKGKHCTVAIDWGQDLPGRGDVALMDGLRFCEHRIISGEELIWHVRAVKSPYEAAMKKQAFAISDIAFDQAIQEARIGITEQELQRSIKCNMVRAGAEHVDMLGLATGKGNFKYGKLLTDRVLQKGDFVWCDMYNTYASYPADRCRTAICGEPSEEVRRTFREVRAVTLEICKSIRAGMTGRDVYRIFEKLWGEAGLGANFSATSRIGHTSGMEITEPGSIADWSDELIAEGMIYHVEPKYEKYDGVFQFEEVVYVTKDGVEFLTNEPPKDIPVIKETI